MNFARLPLAARFPSNELRSPAARCALRMQAEDHRGRGPFPGLRRGRPIGFSGASRGARMSLRGRSPRATRAARGLGGDRRPPGRAGSRRGRRGRRHERRPMFPTLGLRVYVGSSRVREGFPRLCPRAIRAYQRRLRAQTSARSHRHEQRYATLAVAHEVDGSETSASSTPRIAYAVDATPVPSVRQEESRDSRSLVVRAARGDRARSGRRARRRAPARSDPGSHAVRKPSRPRPWCTQPVSRPRSRGATWRPCSDQWPYTTP